MTIKVIAISKFDAHYKDDGANGSNNFDNSEKKLVLIFS